MASIMFKGKEISTNGELPKEGTQAPDFELLDQDFSQITLGTLGTLKKIIYVVPSIDSSVCCTSECRFRKEIENLSDVVLLTVSRDTPFALKKYIETYKNSNNSHLASDIRRQFGIIYQCEITSGILMGLLSRVVIVLDTHNTILHVEQVPDIVQEPNYSEVLRAIR